MLDFRFTNLMYNYDCRVDVLYCKINLPYSYDYTIPVTPIFNIDLAKNVDEVVAFELLDASRELKVPKEELQSKQDIKITVYVDKDVIKVVFNIKTVHGYMGGFSVKALNENNARPGAYVYCTL